MITQDGRNCWSWMHSTISPAALPSSQEWTITRLPSALDAARATNRVRPWLSRDQEAARQVERIVRVRRENGIPSPDEWMW